MVGLNFADEGEADKFHETVNMKLQEKKRRNSKCKGRLRQEIIEGGRVEIRKGTKVGRM